MRRSALLCRLVLPSVLLLGGCSGLGKFFHDTVTLPGMNPNLPSGLSENKIRSEGHRFDEAPLLPERGNVWPGPPQPLPTLSDVSKEQGDGLGGGSGGGSRSPLSGGAPGLRDGGSMGMGENDAIVHGVTSEGGPSGSSNAYDGFGGAGGSLADPTVSAAGKPPHPSAKPTGSDGVARSIVIPNGDGTSTVIGPDGSVQTVNGTPK